MKDVAQGLQHCDNSSLQSLEFARDGFANQDFILSDTLRTKYLLQTLSLACMMLNPGCQAHADALWQISEWFSLNLSQMRFGSQGYRAPTKSLQGNAVPGNLEPTFNKIGGKGQAAVAKLLRHTCSL